MITENEIFKIGKLVKPHGIKGEISFAFENDVFDRVECPYLVCKIDGIFVPFFIKEYRFKGQETALVLFDEINNETKAQSMAGIDVYFPRKYHEEDSQQDIEYSWNFFIGFTVSDKHLGILGTVDEIDEKTINTLFLIKNEDEELIIPATEDFIVSIDAKKKILFVDLPEGLI